MAPTKKQKKADQTSFNVDYRGMKQINPSGEQEILIHQEGQFGIKAVTEDWGIEYYVTHINCGFWYSVNDTDAPLTMSIAITSDRSDPEGTITSPNTCGCGERIPHEAKDRLTRIVLFLQS